MMIVDGGETPDVDDVVALSEFWLCMAIMMELMTMLMRMLMGNSDR